MLAGASGAGGGGGYVIERSLRFDSADSAYLNRTPSSSGNRKTWTWSSWVKRSKLGTDQTIFSADEASGTWFICQFDTSDRLMINWTAGTGGAYQLTTAKFRDTSAWYHFVLAFDTTQSTDTNKIKLYVNGVLFEDRDVTGYPSTNTDYQVNNGNKIHKIGTGAHYVDLYLADVHFIDGQQLAPTDFGEFDDNGVWQPIAYAGTYGTNGFHLDFADNSSTAALGTDTSGNSNNFSVYNLNAGGSTPNYTSGLSYAGFNGTTTFGGDGPGGVGAFDSSDATRLTGNTSTGSGQTAIYTWVPPGGSISASSFKLKFQYFGTNSFGTTSVALNGGSYYTQGGSTSVTTYDFSNLITGGQITEVKVKWVANQSGIGAHSWYGMWIDNVLLVDADPLGIDCLFDSPTNGRQSDTGAGGQVSGNYATLNPLDRKSTVSLSNGNLDATTSSTGWAAVKGTMGVSSGKYYFEATANGSAANKVFFGICASSVKPGTSGYLQDDTTERAKGMLIFCDNGLYQLDGNSRVSYSSSMADGDVISVAYDLDGNTVQFYKNGNALGSIDISSSPLASTTVVPLYIHYNTNTTYRLNFGQRTFAYAAPSGYKALCTSNLPTPTIADGSKYFDTKLYTGTGSTQALTMANSALSPDFVWIKNRNSTYQHLLFDAVRGATKYLKSDATSAEATNGSTLASFDSNGFTLGGDNEINRSSYTYAAWAWDAGTSTVTNNDGDITSSVRANTDSGFSICTYNGNGGIGQTVGHGLSAAPEYILCKCRNSGVRWGVYTKGVGPGNTLVLNDTTTPTGGTGVWGNVNPTSSVFTVSNDNEANGSGKTYVAYCFTPVEGYSAMGKYSANTTSGSYPFIYTGFQPRWIMFKNISASWGWYIHDTARSVDNSASEHLIANYTNAESNYSIVDILSNGFKLTTISEQWNHSSNDYVYLAFAEHPFKTARAR